MAIRIKHDSEYKGNDWWKMWIWLEGSKEELDQIDHVVYVLDPTFPNPVRTVEDRDSKFRLDTAGAGEFSIHAKAVTKDGTNIPIKYDLRLSDTGESWSHKIEYDKGTTLVREVKSIKKIKYDFHADETPTDGVWLLAVAAGGQSLGVTRTRSRLSDLMQVGQEGQHGLAFGGEVDHGL